MKSLLEASGNSILSDIVDFFNPNSKKKKPYTRPSSEDKIYLGGSISNKTKQLIMTFPVLCDNTLPPSTASMINKANERNIVTMLQLLFSSISVSGNDGSKVLSQLHKNVNINSTMDDVIDSIDDFVDNNLKFLPSKFRESVNEVDIKRALMVMQEEMKRSEKVFPINSFSERSLNQYSIQTVHGRTIVTEAPWIDDDQSRVDDYIRGMDPDQLEDFTNRARATDLRDQIERRRREDSHYDEDWNRRIRKDDLEYEMNRRKMRDYEKEKKIERNRTLQQMNKADMDMKYDEISKRILDTDVKKANEMTPTLMVVQFNELDPDGKIAGRKPFVAGVKSRLISVDSTDIIERIVVKNKTKVNFLNFIRATTGEIKFFRDFLFCIDQAKIDAKNSVKKGEAAKMWKVLESRSSKNFHNKARKSGNDASAITTLVINQETVNMIKKNYDFDLERVANAKSILDAYNLLGIVIADESIEVVKFLYAGNDMFEQQAYSYLNKEQADNSYKKIINLISKMNTGR